MTPEDEYGIWKRQRSAIDVGPDFADSVMNRIRTFDKQSNPAGLAWHRIVDWIGGHPVAQAAVIALTTAFALAECVLLLRIGIG